MRQESIDPTNLTPHQRLRELSAILASGIRRSRTNTPVAPDSAFDASEISPNERKSSQNGLEFHSPSRPDGQCQPEIQED